MRPLQVLGAIILATTILIGGCTTKQQPTTPASPAEIEQKQPLTQAPSQPFPLKWTQQPPSVSDKDLSNAVVRSYQLLNSNQVAEALKLLHPLAGAKHADLQLVLGVAEYSNKNVEAAGESYVRAIDVDPKSAPAHSYVANVYRDQKKFDLAAAEYQKAIAADPGYEIAITNFQVMLTDLGRIHWAEILLRSGLVHNLKSVNLLAQLGQNLVLQKRYPEARQVFEAALKLDPNNVVVQEGLAKLPK